MEANEKRTVLGVDRLEVGRTWARLEALRPLMHETLVNDLMNAWLELMQKAHDEKSQALSGEPAYVPRIRFDDWNENRQYVDSFDGFLLARIVNRSAERHGCHYRADWDEEKGRLIHHEWSYEVNGYVS